MSALRLPQGDAVLVAGRYALLAEIASGGMGAVHLGRLVGPVGFARTVAIKRLHAQHLRDANFVAMFLDEARLAARVRHPNVVATLDIVAEHAEFFLVMDYVHGVSMRELLRAASASHIELPVEVVASIIVGTLRGLHGAHEAHGEGGVPLGIVHRDVSPQNIMIGSDGLSRVADFGIAKASWRSQQTTNRQIKGKIGYMAPEQVNGGLIGPWSDVYSCAIVFWEALAQQRLFAPKDDVSDLARFSQREPVLPPSTYDDRISAGLDRVIERGLRFDVAERFASASAMADAIEDEVSLASNATVASWVNRLVGDLLSARAALIDAPESNSGLRASRPDSSRRRQLSPIVREPPPELLFSESETLTRAVPPETRLRRIPRVYLAALALLGLLAGTRAILTLAASHVSDVSTAPARLPDGDPSAPVTPASASPTNIGETSALTRAPYAPILGSITSSGSAASLSKALIHKPLRRAPRPADHCQPPYTEDARGIRHLKLDCLQ